MKGHISLFIGYPETIEMIRLLVGVITSYCMIGRMSLFIGFPEMISIGAQFSKFGIFEERSSDKSSQIC